MNNFQFLFWIMLFASSTIIAQVPCEPECCPNGPEYTFNDLSGSLPSFGTLANGGWESLEGDPFYNSDIGCTSDGSIGLFGTTFTTGDHAILTQSGFGGPIDIFSEGNEYCIQMCINNVDLISGSLELYADGTLIAITPVQVQSDGWQVVNINWLASVTSPSFTVKNNSTGPLDDPPTIYFDDVCINIIDPNNQVSCMADFAFVEEECGVVCFENLSCGEYDFTVWTFFGPGLPAAGDPVNGADPCYTFPFTGIYTIVLEVFCSDGTSSTKTETININFPDPPSFNCPTDFTVTSDPQEDCIYDYAVPSFMIVDGSVLCTLNGVSVNPGDIISLNVGVHTMTCTITGECIEPEICQYLITVTCEMDPECILPEDLPWEGSDCFDKPKLLQPGIAVVTCGVTTQVPSADRFPIGLIDFNNSIPASGRIDITDPAKVYHHLDWKIEDLGNLFGIAINDNSGEILLAASSNYGARFRSSLGTTILRYGNLGGGVNDISAAGTIYRIHPTTGVPSVFTVLPQQAVPIKHTECERVNGGTPVYTVNRTTGVGLGNVCYDKTHDQYFASNMEDGRIYRISATGVILDSYDPLTYDNGAPGFSGPGFVESPYGIAVENNGARLFFGLNALTNSPSIGTAASASPAIYAIDLNSTGQFVGTVDNTTLPAGATYNNYVGTDVLQTTIPIAGGATYSIGDEIYLISDLSFTDNNKLLVGVRVGCDGNFHSSYNHHGESNVINFNSSTGLYDLVNEFDVSAFGWAAREDAYGGVSSYKKSNGDIDYLVSSSDILAEAGPHGIAIWNDQSITNPINPIGAFSYGLLGTLDSKGMGGDVEVFSFCDTESLVDCDSLMVISKSLENVCFDPNIVTGNPCGAVFDPVCGCDGMTYGNACEAMEAGVTTFISGECNGNNTPDVMEKCCHSFDLKNNWGTDILELEVEILTGPWIFNNVNLDPQFQFGSCGSFNQKMCISPVSGGAIPLGITVDAFNFCFASTINNPIVDPVVEFKWKQVINGMDTIIACRDTLNFECIPIPEPDTCLTVLNKEIDCDPNDPTIYNYCFDVINNSTVDVGQVTLECLTPGFGFLPFGTSSIIKIPIPNPLPNGSTSQICVDINTAIPISGPTDVCIKLGLVSSDGTSCCHSPILTCVEIFPCCDPCELKDVIATNISMSDEECCYSIGLENLCEIPYFTKFEAEILTGGVCFGSHVIDPLQAPNWSTLSSQSKICLTPISGTIDQTMYPNLLDFCLDKLDDPSKDMPQIVFRWYHIDPSTGLQTVACTDSLTTTCEAPDSNVCLLVTDQELVCIPDSSKYRYTFTVTNTSNPSFTADKLHLNIKNDPINFGVFPTGPIIPLGTPLAPGQSTTISTCIVTTSFPATIPDLVFSYRLQNMITGDCCFESVCDTIPIPSCSTMDECCDDFDDFCNLIDQGFQIFSQDDCTITIDATQFDSCHWYGTPAPDWGDGSSGFPVITSAVGAGPWTYTYDQSGTYNICITVYEGYDENSFCWNKEMCSEVTIDCLCGELECDDLSLGLDPDDDNLESCCYIGYYENDFCEDYFKGIKVEISAPNSISQLQTYPGWIINQLSPLVAEIYPTTGNVPFGDDEFFSICNATNSGNINMKMSWLVSDDDGNCIEVCTEEESYTCTPNIGGCLDIVQDSIDCDSNMYCFKVINNTSPSITIRSVEFIQLSPSGAVLSPNPISIPPLNSGQTSDWICITYDTAGNSDLCFLLVGHEADLPAGDPVTWCCVDTEKYFIEDEENCGMGEECCDITEEAYDVFAASNFGIAVDSCEVCVDLALDSCDVILIDWGDGSTLGSPSPNDQICHTYSSSGLYTFTSTSYRIDPDNPGMLCVRFDSIIPLDLDCEISLGDCCEDEEYFCDLVDLGFEMSVDSNQLTISTTQFDSCHWFVTSEPDWGDGTIPLVGPLSAADTVLWKHTYDTTGMYNICIEVYEGDTPDELCWSKELCKMLWIVCDSSAEMETDTVDINPCGPSVLNIPTGFTPNGDGLNDVLEITGSDRCLPIDITVFNRWGQIVYSKVDYDNSWNGDNTSGIAIPDGTYFLKVDFYNVESQRLSYQEYIGYLDLRRQ